MSSKLWQQPYVNVFKHFQISEWKKCSKEGDVSTVMDKTLKGTVYRISGSVPAGNYIQFPKTASQSLGLTGHYIYLLFKPIATKYFVVHLDVATSDGIIVRVSFSNIFKEFKSTSTWLQFPFISNPAPGSVEAVTAAQLPLKSKTGTPPSTSRWTLLCIDLHYMLSVYLNRKYAYVKAMRLCASMVVKNVFTSDTKYTPGISMKVARKTGLLDTGFVPLPREMSFMADDLDDWQKKYDFVVFPSEREEKTSRDVIPGRAKSPGGSSRLAALSPVILDGAENISKDYRYSAKQYTENPVKSRISMVDKLLKQQSSMKKVFTGQLPEVSLTHEEELSNDDVHVYADPKDRIHHHHEDFHKAESKGRKMQSMLENPKEPIDFAPKSTVNSLQPDPILTLERLVGVGGGSMKALLWTKTSSHIVYPCHAVIVSMDAKTGQQSFLFGHNDKISALAFNGNTTLLASAQLGENAIIRIWKYKSRKCLTVFQSHVNDPYCISFSQSGSKVCAVGYDNHGKQAVAVWDASFIMNGHKVTLIAKAHVDVHIAKVRICPFDDSRLVTCGKKNIRVWKVKRGSLRSHPVDLGEQHSQEFTDIDFECIQRLVKDASDRLLYSCTTSGALLVINLKTLSVEKFYRLLPNEKSALTSLAVNDSFCVTGWNDGYLRLWPLDFDSPFMEAEHECGISSVATSPDGILVSAIVQNGNVGVLDLSKKSYKTFIRSHLKRITSIAFDDAHNQVATVSEDKGIKIWNRSSMDQLYDFRAPDETPCLVSFHPSKSVLICGFENGCIRVFDVASASLVAENTNHRGRITGLVISPDGNHIQISDARGSLALYDSSNDAYGLVRLIPNALAKLPVGHGNIIALDDQGRRLACIGPSEYMITVFDARSLDELLRIDVTSMADGRKDSKLDAAQLLCYAPSNVRHLVVATSTCKILKLDASTGQLISEITNVHRGTVTAICISPNGRYLATAGDKVIKIWDYHMRMDLNFQVFIGHSDPISNLKFTSDGSRVYSAAECIFIWNFHGKGKKLDTSSSKNRSPKKMLESLQRVEDFQDHLTTYARPRMDKDEDQVAVPRGKVPQPIEYEPLSLNVSPIPQKMPERKHDESLNISSEGSSEESFADLGATQIQITSDVSRSKVINESIPMPVAANDSILSHHAPPTVMAHFKMREKISKLAERRYSAPQHQAGLRLKSAVGYDGRGRNNIIWHPITGLFAYACGCIVVIEDLTTGKQRLLRYHIEDISSLAAHSDGQVIASASVRGPSSPTSQICIWEVKTGLFRKVITHHKFAVVALQYSRDDRFLVTAGDYRECSIAIWSTIDYELLATSSTRYPIHAVRWDPYTMNEFATVGQNGSVLFWLLDETKQQVALNVHDAEVPEDIFTDRNESTFDLTSLVYAGNSVLYVAASNGVVSAWDTRQNKCFMHWKSDNAEILQMVAGHGKLITGGASNNLCLWSVTGVAKLQNAEGQDGKLLGNNGLVMDDEMQLDGCIVSAIFDGKLDIGVVGTSCGTVWYINWDERSSIRLISGHKDQVNSLIFGGNNGDFMASCASDGSMRLWNTESYEQTLQFLVLNQRCSCVAFRPVPQPIPLHSFTQDGRHQTTIHSSSTTANNPRPSQCVAGYSDGTVRLFDLGLVEMILKLQPHPVGVSAIAFSTDGRVIVSGAEDGLIAISSPTTGMTVRILNDHKGAPITDLHVSLHKDHSYSLSSPTLWLAASADRRVSVWTADWSKDFCELVDWLSFPAPNFAPDGTIVKKSDKDYYKRFPPSLARFSPVDSDMIVYTGYGMKKQILYYSLSRKRVIRTVTLTDWALTMDVSPKGNLIAIGSEDRLVKIVDYNEGTFQDYVAHSDSVRVIKFSPNAKHLFSAGFNDVVVWELTL